jgi:hypothetical protein
MPVDRKFSYLGRCSCGNVHFDLLLSNILSTYPTRSCDCDFCTRRNIAYLSDPLAQLSITSVSPLKIFRQGSNQASFQLCPICADVVCVNYKLEDVLKGALNVRMLDDQALLSPARVVSPKRLTPQQKVVRWNAAWMSVFIQ